MPIFLLLSAKHSREIALLRGRDKSAKFQTDFLRRHGHLPVLERLEDGEFRWPKIEDGAMLLSAAQFSALFDHAF
jgi:hypothetical protein